ncbi:hypothetical protein PC41400_14705 [Paenibacillus chitinolyticus]|uniref:Uncharacterized protein n=1 Tax=Paenibacillus chitinolyticus TaxID=79263 RepID=A0A410WWZ5_9BACL|nr:hypothetical protein [Paenibacillus chitinolyticus]MCY9593977.1 hypothetical protein [Paenibacillus chitinolyticus]MCY9599632.1 hypothetical protein [Paenibacillus chitinolyticus]QAV18860.1 hypothetical protein PC41400_14705 [Paenibacillus chitinolyticus]
MIKYHESIIKRELYKYDDVEERERHHRQMFENGWHCKSQFDFLENYDWSNGTPAAEYLKQEQMDDKK